MRIALLGSGNVATHLGRALQGAGEEIVQVWSRSIENAAALAGELHAAAINDLTKVTRDADVYIISVNDDAIGIVASQLSGRDKILVHTSGSTGMNVLEGASDQIGVFYPLQTFSKSKPIDFKTVPLAVEGSSDSVLSALQGLAHAISDTVVIMDSVQRRALHVAAVFACNFSNHLYALAAQILRENQLDFELLRPLILETAEKVQTFTPEAAQTGPAVRRDQQTMERHLELLRTHPELADLYRRLSQSIVNLHK